MTEQNTPELRFPEFKEEWIKQNIGNYLVEYKKYGSQNETHYPVATSSRRGLYMQNEYFEGDREFAKKDVLYSIVPVNYFTYRHMSDDNIFKFNINTFNIPILVSKEYPVFTINNYYSHNFIFYELNNNNRFEKFCRMQKKGGTRTRLYFKVLKEYKAFFPNYQEQSKIGDFFSKLDYQIELEEKKLELLEQQKNGYMQKIFSQELRFKDENGNEYPEWELIKLEDILIERKEYASKTENYPHATLSTSGISLKSDRYNRDFLVRDKNKKYKITLMNDICYNPANLKFGVITRNSIGSVIFSPIYITFEVNNGYSPLFIELLVTRKDFINRVRKYEEGTVYERMSVKPEDFLNYETKIPCLEEQKKIGLFFTEIDKCSEILEQKIKLLKQLKKGLLQKMFI
ncbi:restriction endonuclease subunit S [Staphylococcus capitis]|uniref:restriction endonuclease subunit S n=1 Tax=Staphylococcus capitis TaxID=29388 RepID=UPI00021A3202|nr:restriction endonuclease subunit S [Staphylococcus capitis]EGS40102.1 type I restriction modification DNA specificity domain protein [Staphylococcus capitis VCU116]MBN6785218.1 restriction endonuclease subunit S [Staphylococcus capitis]MEB5629183.1 restriction endonuclease subunit S [Staphylococcus capitis]